MYTYNKNDNSYTFSFDELDIDDIINLKESSDDPNKSNENNNTNNDENVNTDDTDHPVPHKKIEVINGGNDLDISPVSDYIEIEKPKNEKIGNIVIPEDNK